MPDLHAMGALAGQGLLAIACLSALFVAGQLRDRWGDEASRWLAWRLVGTVLLVGFAAAVDVFELEQPAGSVSDLLVLSGFVLFAAVFLLDVPFHLWHPRRAELVEDRPRLPWSILALPLVGLAYVLFAWPGRAPVTFAQAQGDESLMATRMAWSSRYDVVEDAAVWMLLAAIVMAALALLLVQGWRALRGSAATRRRARRMLGQAAVGPLAWLAAAGLVAGLGVAGVSSLSPGLAFASGLLFEPGLPVTFLLLGPLLWARDILRGRARRQPPPAASGSANAS